MKIYFLFFLLLVLSTYSIGYANPEISKCSGKIQQGGKITITGANFGNNTLNYSTLIKKNSALNQSPPNQTPQNKAGWFFNLGAGQNPTVSTTTSRSNGRSLLHDRRGTPSCCNSALRYDYGTNIPLPNTIYVTWWTKAAWSSGGQWKMFRINWQNDIQDDAPQMAMFNWTTISKQLVNRPGPLWDSPGSDHYLPQTMTSLQNTWYRIELIIQTSSALGAYDGSYRMRRYTPGSTVAESYEGGHLTHNTLGRSWRWFLWQNYSGNGMENFFCYTDDHYVQVGSQARIELCDAEQWISRKTCDIQVPLSWEESNIEVEVNTGPYQNGEVAYLYIIDEYGDVNAIGHPLVIGAENSSGDIKKPNNFQLKKP